MQTLFYHNDQLSGVNVLSDSAGARVELVEYDPWGKISRELPAGGAGDLTHRFTGEELDAESNLYNYGGRYYDHLLGRFISPDPLTNPFDPQSLNRYSYVRNNPASRVDPSGFSDEDSDGFAVAAVPPGDPLSEQPAFAPNCCPDLPTPTPTPDVETSMTLVGTPTPTDPSGPAADETGANVRVAALPVVIPVAVGIGIVVGRAAGNPGTRAALSKAGEALLKALAPLGFGALFGADTSGGGSDGTNVGEGQSTPASPDPEDPGARVRAADEPSNKPGLTKAGHGLAKHGGRPGSAFPKPKGNPTDVNRLAREIVQDIVNHPQRSITVSRSTRHGLVTNVRAPDGRGVRFGSDGRFIGFLEP